MNDDFCAENIVNALGSVGEMAGVFYKSLLKNGFEKEDAMDLVRVFVTITLSNKSK